MVAAASLLLMAVLGAASAGKAGKPNVLFLLTVSAIPHHSASLSLNTDPLLCRRPSALTDLQDDQDIMLGSMDPDGPMQKVRSIPHAFPSRTPSSRTHAPVHLLLCLVSCV